MAITELLIGKITGYLVSRDFYVGLNISDPVTASNPNSTELTSLTYLRGLATFEITSSGLGAWNKEEITIIGLPFGSVTHAGVWTSQELTKGELIFSAELDNAPITIKPEANTSAQTYKFAVHQLVLSFD
jgi:hypothetical protein